MSRAFPTCRMTEESKQVENIGAGKDSTPATQQPLTTASTNTPAGSTPSSKTQGQPLVCNRNPVVNLTWK